jgi:hypothetical protein
MIEFGFELSWKVEESIDEEISENVKKFSS